jgi:hypothetical protein
MVATFLLACFVFLHSGDGHLNFQRSEIAKNVAEKRKSSPTSSSKSSNVQSPARDNYSNGNGANSIFVSMPETLEVLKIGDQVTFPLPDWIQITGVVTQRYDHPAQKSWTVIGALSGTSHGTFTLGCSSSEGSTSCVGNVRPMLNSSQYELRRLSEDLTTTATAAADAAASGVGGEDESASTSLPVHVMSLINTNQYEDHDGTGLAVREEVHSLMLKELRESNAHHNHNPNPLESEPEASESYRSPPDDHSAASAAGAAGARSIAGRGITLTAQTDTNDILDILVVYTPTARQWAGGVNAMELLITMAMDESNQILSNSGVSLRFRLVHQTQTFDTSFQDPASGSTLLNYMTFFSGETNDPTGILDAEQALRETYKADLVVVISGPTDVCGVAWQMKTTTSTKYAVSLTAVNCMVGYYTFGHEIGHNLGSTHDATATSTSRMFTYSQGWCWDKSTATGCDGSCMRTVMAYASCISATYQCTDCPKTMYYSNPNVVVYGNVAGNAATADNARSLNYFRPWAQAYRASLQPGGMVFSVEPSSMTVNTCGQVTITGWRMGSGSDISSVKVGGVEVSEIVSQTMDSVVVVVSPSATVSASAVDVVVTTSGGMVTTAPAAFSYIASVSSPSSNVVVTVDFESAYSPLESTGELGWYLYNSPCPSSSSNDPCKNYGPRSSASGVFSMVDVDGSGRDGIYSLPVSSGGCVDTLLSVSLKYFAYSVYSFCFSNPFLRVEIQTSPGGVWTSIASASTVTSTSTSAWSTLSTSIQPTVMYGLRLRAITYSSNNGCDYYNPVALDDIVITYQRSCVSVCSPGGSPSVYPTSAIPTEAPSLAPSRPPTMVPTTRPSIVPSSTPTRAPSQQPSLAPSRTPTLAPTAKPSTDPTFAATRAPTLLPTTRPSIVPSSAPTRVPTRQPSLAPSRLPTRVPTTRPSIVPSSAPTRVPTRQPSLAPSRPPTRVPTTRPSIVPSSAPTRVPTRQPSAPTRTPSLTPALALA